MLRQLRLFPESKEISDALLAEQLGTFRDSLQAPVHRWFKYPAGFSYRLVETLIDEHSLGPSSWLLDCFVGSGTTSVVAKQRGVNSIGIEAHPFVYWVAKTKTFWEFDMEQLRRNIQALLAELAHIPPYPGNRALSDFPDLVRKCYSDSNLWVLKHIRDTIERYGCTEEERDFFRLALTDTLRVASSAGTGWPYIAPSRFHAKNERPALEVFTQTTWEMYWDLISVISTRAATEVETRLLQMDARDSYPVESQSVDLAVTSPPYLNNYDYADRTRLEMYFFGWARSWADITHQVRDKLITAATTQVRRTDFDSTPLSPEIEEIDSSLFRELLDKIALLSRERLKKGGHKGYDLMVAGYFNDMVKVIKQVHRVLRPGSQFVLVLGDSAPYGVHIPTEEYLARLALGIGFRDYRVQVLRERGGKWGHNPQRHKVALKESILLLQA